MVYIQNDGITQIPHSAAFVKFLDCWFVWSGFGKMQVVYHIPSGLVEISQKHIIRVFTYPRKKRQNSSPLLEGNSRDSQKSLTPPYTSPHITPYKQAWLYIYVCIIYIHINIHIYIYIYIYIRRVTWETGVCGSLCRPTRWHQSGLGQLPVPNAPLTRFGAATPSSLHYLHSPVRAVEIQKVDG